MRRSLSGKQSANFALRSVYVCLCIILCIARPTALSAAERESFIDDTLGGLRLGDHIQRAKQLYPALRPSVEWEGGYEVQIGHSCLLAMSTDVSGPQSGRIRGLSLEILKPTELSRDPECANLRSGKGFLIGQDMGTAERIYNAPAIFDEPDSLTISIHNGDQCESGETTVMKSMTINWSKKTQMIKYYAVEASEDSCLDYIAGGTADEAPQ